MTTTPMAGHTTVDQLLFAGGDTILVAAAGTSLVAAAATINWTGLTAVTQGAVLRELVSALHAISDIDLGDILIDGWRSHTALQAAGARTLRTGVPEVVELARHRIEHQVTSHVDLLRNGTEIGQVTCTIIGTADITAVSAGVDSGRLASLHSGDATLVVSLRLDDREVASSQPHQIHVPIDVRLGAGVWLVEHPAPEVAFKRSHDGWTRASS